MSGGEEKTRSAASIDPPPFFFAPRPTQFVFPDRTLWKTTRRSSSLPCRSPQMVTCLLTAVLHWLRLGSLLRCSTASMSTPATYLACSRCGWKRKSLQSTQSTHVDFHTRGFFFRFYPIPRGVRGKGGGAVREGLLHVCVLLCVWRAYPLPPFVRMDTQCYAVRRDKCFGANGPERCMWDASVLALPLHVTCTL